MANDPTVPFSGKITNIQVSGAGAGSAMLSVTVSSPAGAANAVAAPSDQPDPQHCSPAIFQALIDVSLVAFRTDTPVVLGYNPQSDGSPNIIQFIELRR